MDFYSNPKKTQIIRYIFLTALLIIVLINVYISFVDIEIKYFKTISSVILIASIIFSFGLQKNIENKNK